MTEGSNQMAGRPYGGRNEKPDDAGLPGERPPREDEKTVGPPRAVGAARTTPRRVPRRVAR